MRDTVFIFQSQPGNPAIQALENPRPYTDVIVEAYNATPALREEYRRLQRYMAPVPQCMVDAITAEGELVLAYRLYADGERMLIDVQRMP
ncbi:hypothetical protein HMPREF9946_03676 [Acetobacteraceae bacterium AT-5844]|nr:hypothetical protein HMPREF9946_03676 [Acetobacteraceae bacterium AT-5844]